MKQTVTNVVCPVAQRSAMNLKSSFAMTANPSAKPTMNARSAATLQGSSGGTTPSPGAPTWWQERTVLNIIAVDLRQHPH